MNISTDSRVEGLGHASIDAIPDTCPLCNCGIAPLGLDYAFATEAWLEKPFRCPRADCQRLFIARYKREAWPGAIDPTPQYRLAGCVPFRVTVQEFGDTIQTISPQFVAIHGQAEQAEKRSLSLVSGPGFRKALEFLIKDYVIRLHPNEAELVTGLPLSDCIKKYVSNERITAVASRAVWLGNDQTHYAKLWTDKDLKDLKALIQLTVRWIEMEELTKAVVEEMPSARKKGAGNA